MVFLAYYVSSIFVHARMSYAMSALASGPAMLVMNGMRQCPTTVDHRELRDRPLSVVRITPQLAHTRGLASSPVRVLSALILSSSMTPGSAHLQTTT